MNHNAVTTEPNQIDPHAQAVDLLKEYPLLNTKLSRALFCSAEESAKALAEVIKFLILAAGDSQPVTPSSRVDVAWHEFILFTRAYAAFCQEKLGKMVHHQPSEDHETNSHQYLRTLHLYRNRFGQPPAEYWDDPQVRSVIGRAAHCGSCESGSQ